MENEEVVYQNPEEESETSTKYFMPPSSGDYKFFAKCSGDCEVVLGDDRVIPEEKIISVNNQLQSGDKRRCSNIVQITLHHLFSVS